MKAYYVYNYPWNITLESHDVTGLVIYYVMLSIIIL